MKKTNLILIIAIALYSWLFYEQLPGINFLLFTIAILVLSVINRKEIGGYTSWRIAAFGAIISAVCIAWHGNFLSFIANVISLSMVSMLSVNKKSSVAVSVLTSFVMILSSWVLVFLDRFFPEKKESEIVKAKGKNSLPTKLIIFGIPVIIITIFIILYRASNPVFDYFASLINLDFISFNWVMFTFSGCLVMYAFFYTRELKAISNYDIN